MTVSVELQDHEYFDRLSVSWCRYIRQALLIGAALENREKWKDALKDVGEPDQWSYEFRAVLKMLTGEVKPSPGNVQRSKLCLMLSDKSPKTIVEQCVIWCRISNLETRRAECVESIKKTKDAALIAEFEGQIVEIEKQIDETRERLGIE